MSDLLIATHTPILRSGQLVRTYGVARAMAAAGGLTMLYARFEGDQPDDAFTSIPGIELVGVEPSRAGRRAIAYGSALLAGVPRALARGISPELTDAAERLAAMPGRGRVVADGPIAAAAVRVLARRRPVIYNAHNVESAFRGELSQGGSLGRLRRFEQGLLAGAEESWMVSHADLELARAMCPSARLRYVPNVVDVKAIEQVLERASEPRAVFVGNFAYEPNLNGARFLIEEVFPRVWERLPQARLMLVGRGLAEQISSDPRIEAVGFCPDLAWAYGQARCAVVPLLQGGGTPLKFVEALAYGLPVIATRRAAAGLEVHDGIDCLLADGAEEFAASLTRALLEDVREIGARGRELAEGLYSIETLTRLLAA